jgi:hypothetical protein
VTDLRANITCSAVRALAGGTRGEDGIRDLCVAYTRTLVRAAGASSAVEPPS